MTYNATVDIDNLNIDEYVKYTDDPTYNNKERNILYLPYDVLSHSFVDNFNSMIVRNNNGYYDDMRSKLNYNINNNEITDIYRKELYDYVELYNQYLAENNKTYDKIVYNFLVSRIIKINRIINNRLQLSNNVNMKTDNYYLYVIGIGLLLFAFVIYICVNFKKYYKTI
jgi:hypothetical protein